MTAADIYRNLIARQTFEYLFKPTNPDPREFPILALKARFLARVRNQGALSYQFIACPDGGPVLEGMVYDENNFIVFPALPLKTPKILRSRGIKIVRAIFSEPKPVEKQAVRDALLDHWASRWEKAADYTTAEFDLQARRVHTVARKQSQDEILTRLTQIMGSSTHAEEALALRVFQELENISLDPSTRKVLTPATTEFLRNIHNWLLPGEPPPDGGSGGDDEDDSQSPWTPYSDVPPEDGEE
jgi:hypothetical protein